MYGTDIDIDNSNPYLEHPMDSIKSLWDSEIEGIGCLFN